MAYIIKSYKLLKGNIEQQWSGRPGFNPGSCHTKDFKKWYFKNGT